MHASLQRRALLALSLAAAAALTACGSSSVESALKPERFLSVGDGYSDVGQGPGGARATVNDGSFIWTEQIASHYGITVKAANAGGLSWAQAYSRVTQADITGHNAPSITQQVTSLLAHTTIGPNDIVLVSGGISDVYAEVEASGGVVTDATRANVRQAGVELGQQVRRLVQAGAQHVAMTGVYNMGTTPWGLAYGDVVAKDIADLSRRFNDAVVIEVTSLSANVLFRDSALIYNLIANEPETFGVDNQTAAVCAVPDAYNCNSGTLLPGVDYEKFMWADSLHLTPRLNRVFGDRSYNESLGSQLEDRW